MPNNTLTPEALTRIVEDNNIRLQSVVGYNVSSRGGTVLTADGYPYADLTATNPNAGGAGPIPTDEIEVDSVIAPFGSQRGINDVIELHIYNPVDELLESVYSAPYRAYRGLSNGGNRDINRVDLDLHTIFRDLGYISGKFKFQLNFHRHVLGNDTDVCNLTAISSDRTEITISYPGEGTLEGQPVIDFYGNRIEYFLNAGENLLYRIALVRLNDDLTTNTETVYTLTLAEPLPAEFGLGDTFWVDLQVADPKVDTIVVLPGQTPEELNYLRGPNFNVEIHVAQSTALKSWDDILGSNPTSSQQLINKFISSSFDTIDLPVDYRDYSQFVFYGSATERLDNFRYKLQLVEYYQGLLAASANIANPYIGSNYQDVSRKLNNLLAGFDGYERYLYYESSSYESSSYGEFTPSTWPKQNSSPPYTLYSVNSAEGDAWYRGQRESASYYDKYNDNALHRLIPEHIIVDYYNEGYITFVNMIGQHFDILWSYVNHLSKVSSREESLNRGLAKDLVYHVLRSHGLDSAHGFKLEELWLDALALNSSGTYTQSGSLQSIPNSDISKETFKRILNNLPYLLKTKGTKRGIRALLNCYGVPSTIYRVKEFSGPYQYSSNVFDNDSVYRQVEKFTLATYFNGSNSFTAGLSGTATRIFRFKPASPTGSTNICTGISLTYTSGVEGTLKGVTGPWYNGYWTTVASAGGNLYAFQVINGRVIEYNLGAGTVGTTFGGAGCNVYVQEIKGFSSTLGLQELHEHARNPQSLIGSNTIQTYSVAGWQNSDAYDYTTSYNELLWRFPMGTTLQLYTGSISIPSIHPNKTVSRTGTISGFTSASYVGNVEDYYVWYPNLADSLDIAEKIRIESASLSGSLSPDFSVEKNQFDFYSFDSPKVGVYFSPQDEINEDIADQFSGLSMDNLIGDPRNETSYPALQAVARHYHLKYTSDNIFWKYLKLVENFDASMFYLIKKFLPARSVKMVGLVIQPTLLERSKIAPLATFELLENTTFDANFGQITPDDLTGDSNSYDANIATLDTSMISSENETLDTSAQISSVVDISGEFDSYDAIITMSQGFLSSNIDNVMDQAGIRFIPAGVWNRTYRGCRLSSRAVNIPSPDTFDGAPVIELWTNSPNTPVNSTGPGGSISLANSPNTSGGRFNAVFPNGLMPAIGLNGRVVTNFTNPTNLDGKVITNFTNPIAQEGRAIVNFTQQRSSL